MSSLKSFYVGESADISDPVRITNTIALMKDDTIQIRGKRRWSPIQNTGEQCVINSQPVASVFLVFLHHKLTGLQQADAKASAHRRETRCIAVLEVRPAFQQL
jgi:hypothetical protein